MFPNISFIIFAILFFLTQMKSKKAQKKKKKKKKKKNEIQGEKKIIFCDETKEHNQNLTFSASIQVITL